MNSKHSNKKTTLSCKVTQTKFVRYLISQTNSEKSVHKS